jgi:Phosphotransferase enzyme family
MGRGHNESTAPSTTGERFDLEQLPIGAIDLELTFAPTDLIGSRTVLLMPGEQGPPAAVLKVGRGALEAQELRTQRHVLAELAIHQNLDAEWRDMLPRTLAFAERNDATIAVESYRQGIDLAEALTREPNRAEELTAAALIAIAPLHQKTVAFVGVNNVCLLRRWVLEPLAGLADMCRRLDPGLLPEVNWLKKLLRHELLSWRLPVGWTHGNYTPDNVRVAGVEGPVTGIVGWGSARRGRIAVIDEYLMALTVSCQVDQADFGAVVSDRLRAGGLIERERNALRAAHEFADARAGDDERTNRQIDERSAILLAWLHHVADQWRRRDTPPNHHIWWATRVAPVLGAVAAMRGLEAAHAQDGQLEG